MVEKEVLNQYFYLNNQKVVVIEKKCFRLVEVRYFEEDSTFFIDENLLTEKNKITLRFVLIFLEEEKNEFGFFA